MVHAGVSRLAVQEASRTDIDAGVFREVRALAQVRFGFSFGGMCRPRCADNEPSTGNSVDASNLSAEEFARCDTNGDGVIDANEMAAFLSDIKEANFKLTKVAALSICVR